MNLSDMLQSDEYMEWEICSQETMDKNNPERFNRCELAAKDGADGSLHAEVIADWTQFLELNFLNEEIPTREYLEINIEILDCWDWHDKNGSLYDEVG